MLSKEEADFFWEHGYLHVPCVFGQEETAQLCAEMDRLMKDWALTNQGWSGDWRQEYMDEDTEKKSQLTSMHDLWYYSAEWMRAVTSPRLVGCLVDLLGPDVELHHSTMHVKPPAAGHPFPMHQDWAFYKHIDNRYIDVLVHLDDTSPENGEIRFLDGSHKLGALEHIAQTKSGAGCTPHLPTSEYSLEDSVPVPAQRGDVVLFNIHTIHGSDINRTNKARRMVRIGYRAPDNIQTEGQSKGRPSVIVAGQRLRREEAELFTTEHR